MGHKKPTQEELDAQAKKALEDAQRPTSSPSPSPSPSEPPPTPSASPSASPSPSPSPSEPPPEPPTPPQPPKKEEKKPEDLSPESKLSASAREALVLHSKNQKLTQAIEQASNIADPTEDELKQEYPEWDVMTETEKKLAKENLLNTRRMRVISDTAKEFKDLDVWVEKVDAFIQDPKTLVDYPALEGRIDDFRKFVLKPTRRGVDIPDLIAAFLFEAGKEKPKVKKRRMFESGSGGPNDRPEPKSDKISLSEAQILMKTDYRKYKQLLKEGKIDFTNV